VGQPVGLKYLAFPYQEFGIQRAQIGRIDTAILAPSELRAPVAIDEPVYRVSAELAQQHILAFGSPHPLQSGMRFEADIVLERRSFLAWLLEPIYKIRSAPVAASAS
jgi:membrane fusion protein